MKQEKAAQPPLEPPLAKGPEWGKDGQSREFSPGFDDAHSGDVVIAARIGPSGTARVVRFCVRGVDLMSPEVRADLVRADKTEIHRLAIEVLSGCADELATLVWPHDND